MAAASRRALLRTAAAAGVTASLPHPAWAAVPEAARDMGRAAGAWLAALDRGSGAKHSSTGRTACARAGTTCRAAGRASPSKP